MEPKAIDVDNIFACNVTVEIIKQDEDLEPKFVKEYRQKNDWPKWKDAIQVGKCEVFGPIVKHLRV